MAEPPGADAREKVTVETAGRATPELVAAVARLLPQLSQAPAPGAAELEEVLARPGTLLFVAREGDRIVGMSTLVVLHLLTGARALLEDVVVDETFRGRGVGAALVSEALVMAQRAGARHVDLTSRPSREAANRLYERAGFARRETNLWRFTTSG